MSKQTSSKINVAQLRRSMDNYDERIRNGSLITGKTMELLTQAFHRAVIDGLHPSYQNLLFDRLQQCRYSWEKRYPRFYR